MTGHHRATIARVAQTEPSEVVHMPDPGTPSVDAPATAWAEWLMPKVQALAVEGATDTIRTRAVKQLAGASEILTRARSSELEASTPMYGMAKCARAQRQFAARVVTNFWKEGNAAARACGREPQYPHPTHCKHCGVEFVLRVPIEFIDHGFSPAILARSESASQPGSGALLAQVRAILLDVAESLGATESELLRTRAHGNLLTLIGLIERLQRRVIARHEFEDPALAWAREVPIDASLVRDRRQRLKHVFAAAQRNYGLCNRCAVIDRAAQVGKVIEPDPLPDHLPPGTRSIFEIVGVGPDIVDEMNDVMVLSIYQMPDIMHPWQRNLEDTSR